MEFGNDTFTKSALLLAIGFPVTELLLSGDVLILSEEPSHVQKYAIRGAWRGGPLGRGCGYLPIAKTSY